MLDQFDSSAVTKIASPPRARGELFISARRRGDLSTLADLRQRGSAKALFPAGAAPKGALDAVALNTAGGVTGGDCFEIRCAAEAGAWLRVATQTAERAYRARPGETGAVDIRLDAGADARIDWLPQETILFDRSSLRRSITVDLAGDARLLAVEPIVFGRAAMGERLQEVGFADHWRVRRGGALIYADALRLPRAFATDGAALLRGALGMASILYVGPDAEDLRDPLRVLLPETAGASLVRPGVLAARLLAPDGLALRRALIPALELLGRAPLPKVWTL